MTNYYCLIHGWADLNSPCDCGDQTNIESYALIAIATLVRKAHGNSKSKGFWDGEKNDGEAVALIHSECSELLEAIRKGDPPDEHCPEFTSREIELADFVIRCLDYAGGRNLRLGPAILAKMAFNQTRPHKHGKKF